MEHSLFTKLAAKEISEIYDLLEEKNLDWDIDLISDVLYLQTEKGDYVINQHSPTKQIWLSSPVSSAGYFNYNAEKQIWLNKHNHSIRQVLSTDLGITI